MKNKKIYRIFGIALILALLLAMVPATAAFAIPTTNTISVTPATARVGDTVTVHGIFVPSTSEFWINIYMSPQLLTVGASSMITGAATYQMAGTGALLSIAADNPDGTFTATFVVPANMVTGPTDAAVTTGTYYVYATKVSSIGLESGITALASLGVTTPMLDALNPATGAAGTQVNVTGSSFTANAALTFKFDTTPLTPTGDATVRASGLFISYITIPATATPGVHTISIFLGSSTTAAATTTFTVSAPASLSALSPATGPAGTDITVQGANWPANGALVFRFDTTTLTPKAGSLQAGSNGAFMSIITVPSTTAAGSFLVTVTSGTTSVTASFIVTPPPTTTPPATTPPATTPPTTTPPATTPPATTPPVTTPVTPAATWMTAAGTGTLDFLAQPDASGTVSIFGMGYTPSSVIIFKYDGVQVATGTATTAGIASAQITLPASIHGDHQLAATDGVNTGVLTYTVESIAPGVPAPLAPGMNGKEKLPVTFQWGDVTDPSLPVTYNLQISTNPAFPSTSIVISKTKLTVSEYTLTDADSALLNSSTAIYYWREQAVDGAQNESLWTGAGAFTVIQPLKFTGWPMYAVMAGLFVVGFLIGLVFGRKTAFSY